MQEIPHAVPSHVAEPFAGVGHGEHDDPHVAVAELLTHAPPQTWKPALHVKPHVEPSHVAVLFAGGVQGVQLAPHDATLELLEHAAPHTW